MSIESVMPSNHLIVCHPLLLLPSIFPSIRVFSNESTLRTRWPQFWSFSFSISPSNEHPGLISFRMDWLDLLAVQGTLKSLLQHRSSKASSLQCSAFFTANSHIHTPCLSYPLPLIPSHCSEESQRGSARATLGHTQERGQWVSPDNAKRPLRPGEPRVLQVLTLDLGSSPDSCFPAWASDLTMGTRSRF